MFLADIISPDLLRLYWTASLGLLGLFIGSFLNVCIYRLPAGISVGKPRRSYCYYCGSTIRAADNIPVLSYFLLGGKCRYCSTPFSPRYAGVELLTAALFALVGWKFGVAGLTPALLVYVVFISLMIVATFTDIDHFIIPDSISLGGGAALVLLTVLAAVAAKLYGAHPSLGGGPIATGLIPPVAYGWPFDQIGILAWAPWWAPAFSAVLGAAVGAGLLYGIGVIGKLIFRKDAMGLGDVKLMVGIGAVLGPVHTAISFFVACVVGSVISLTFIAIQKSRGPGKGIVREEYPAMGGGVEMARDAELHRQKTADPEELLEDGDEGGESTVALHGRLFANAALEKRPYTLNHLPFGPYLAIGALLVLFFHQYITRDMNSVFYILELRQRPPAVVRWNPPTPQPDFSPTSRGAAHTGVARSEVSRPAGSRSESAP